MRSAANRQRSESERQERVYLTAELRMPATNTFHTGTTRKFSNSYISIFHNALGCEQPDEAVLDEVCYGEPAEFNVCS